MRAKLLHSSGSIARYTANRRQQNHPHSIWLDA
jgi:hypothetical protein